MIVIIPGQPLAKGRARSGRGHHYTPEKTRSWEAFAAYLMRDQHQGPPLDVPVRVRVTAVGKRPKRLMRRKDPESRIWRAAKPDGDNVLKAVCDAMTKAGIVTDDARIVDKRVVSLYAAKHEAPCVEVSWVKCNPYPIV